MPRSAEAKRRWRRRSRAPRTNAEQASRSLRHGLISLALLVALAVGLLLAVPGLKGVANTVGRMSPGWVIISVGFEVLSCLSYVLVFLSVFDRAPLRFGARVALSELAFGAAVSVGGAGSVAVGAWLLVERGAPPARVAERSAVLFLVTSAINLITLMLVGVLLFAGVLPGSQDPLLSIVPAGVAAAVFVFFLFLPAMSGWIAAKLSEGKLRTLLLEAARSIRDTERMLRSPSWGLLGAVGYLWFDIGVLIACFAALGHTPPLAVVVLAYQIGYLSNLIPVPGGVGVLDGSFVGLFVLFGISGTAAAAATIVYHAVALWIPGVWGTVAFLLLRRTRSQPLTPRAGADG